MRTRLLAIATMGVALLASCSSDPGQVSELEEPPLIANDEVASLEKNLFTATSISIAATRTIKGTIALGDGDHRSSANSTACWGDGGYDDVSEGANVVVRDSEGGVMGTSSLEA